MKKVLLILIFASCFLKVTAQHSINDYKYVIVEKQFHFQNEANEYNLNELVRFLLKKNGFRPILESDVFPADLKSNYCLALQSEVKSSGFLKTIITITLRDCNKNIIYVAEGSTKEKDFDKVYSYGIRKAFVKFDDISYNYVPNKAVLSSGREVVTTSTEDKSEEVKKLKAEIKALKKEKVKQEEIKKDKTEKLKSKPEKVKETSSKKTKKKIAYLEAVVTDNGYNLINAETKKVIHVITKTGMDNVFTVNGNKGLVYKKDGKWIREYTKGKKTIIETLNIIF